MKLPAGWSVILIRGSWFARYSEGIKFSDTGPYSTSEQARDWILGVGQ